ncbi:MAG: 23S rRNA (guanosine(2251)-2'-O)-methyltransferase RlmB, partial [Gammaproteobacteria bacterium]|nr:23S rRNA (guanosine(2251)-2'-O)-methyltransferase RlmB [Gammaproteobacteria bacterium]
EAPALDERGLLARLVERGDRALLLVLDSITDPRNLGACLRGAAAAGADAVVVPANHSTRLNAAARKTASGAAEILPLVAVTNLARFLDRLKQAGIWIAGADAGTGASLFEQDLTGPIALVLGAEGKGIRRLVKEKCDHLVAIPTTGAMTSLNVAVAAGICLFEVRRQRGIA